MIKNSTYFSLLTSHFSLCFRRSVCWLLVFATLSLVPSFATAQAPSFRSITGFELGERITQHAEMVRYLETLGSLSPRVAVRDQGTSWEGRHLLYAIVTSPENHARLAQIEANAGRLADPEATPVGEMAAIAANQPVIVWYGGSIHGFELSGSEGLLKLLEHLTTLNDFETLEVLDDAVLLIDPMLNPDGRDAFAHRNHENIGTSPNANNQDWSNDFTPWEALKFRTGHYYFDTNRDWFAHTQPETRLRLPTILAWRPQAIIDMHDMGPNLEFFFYPGAPPTTPYLPPFAGKWIERFADQYAAAFDSAGFTYLTREQFDYFYPGYTDSHGSFQGAAGMLYEQGSSRGLALTRSDQSVRTLSDALQQQYAAAWTAARYAATNRSVLLREYYDATSAAIAAGRTGITRYLFTPEGDEGHRGELADLLGREGITVEVLTASAQLSGVRDRLGQDVVTRTFEPGTYVIEVSQPRAHLIRTLLEPETATPSDFLEVARARIDRGENPRFYDITAWSLPLLFDIQGFSSTDRAAVDAEPVNESTQRTLLIPRAVYAYLLDGWQAASAAALFHLTDGGHRASMTLKPTRILGNDIPSGTVVVRVGENGPSVHDAIQDLATQYNLNVRTVTTGLADVGFPSLGSADVINVRRPEIAILAEDPIRGYSFGWAWYTLDRLYHIPSTVRRVRSVAETPLDRFDVLLVPSAPSDSLSSSLTKAGVERIRRWVRDGGTLVALGASTEFAYDEDGLGLIDLRSWYDTEDGKEAQKFAVPGAILRANLDPEYWLSAGYQERELPVLVNGTRIYLEPEGPPSARRRVVGRYAATDSIRISGVLWPESADRLGGAVFAYEQRVGHGRVIAFAEDLNFRGFWRGANRLFLNAVVVGPSAP